ncbi:MAG: 2-oxoacid:acceptor oxidoreductase family protein [Bacteroidaceae bacterium]|nr:2-oxoacid:acceptor oxidoreductase family protein [Bacteroidaceae bacterium]
MKEEIIISGFGGQGVLSMGKLLAYAAMMEGKEVTWLPAYGPEQRGGTANVTVIISDQPIASPIVSTYSTAILLNQPSLERFTPAIKTGGTLIFDTYGIIAPPSRPDIQPFRISAMDAAASMKNIKTFNMFILGGLIKVCPIVTIENIKKALEHTLPLRHHHLLAENEAALLKGMEIIEKV